MLEYGFFNAVDGDRTYNADSFNEFFSGILSDTGIYKKSGGALEVTAGEGMSVNVATGKARIDNHWANLTAVKNIPLLPAEANPRYDAIMLTYYANLRRIDLSLHTGEASASPVKPKPSNNENSHGICLAYIYVAPGATSIVQSNIEDTRNDTALCGYVKMQIDAVNAGIRQYRNIVTTAAEVSTLDIGIPEYDAENDLLFANINGIMFVEGSDYTVSGTGSTAKIVLTNSIRANNVVEFRVIKSVIEVL